VGKAAAIDLGSNTFHLVIFEKNNKGEIVEIYRKRHHVFLSRGGVDKIKEESLGRAQRAIADFKEALIKIPVDKLKIIGTAALRKASNGAELKAHIENELQEEVQVISGKREAELIAKGVQWELKEKARNGVIMDIGGGSVEFIHLQNGNLQWLQSFPLGVGVLHSKFPHQEPIPRQTIKDIKQFITEEASELLSYIKDKNITHLIGCSGSFEIIPAIKEGKYPPTISFDEVSLADFHKMKDLLFNLDLEERKELDGLPPVRAELIIVAIILMDFMIELLGIESISISKYAVKEGLISEMLSDNF
jgi:exopolyphosphatase/guanosine-5'-triphosphate,3'-diphosphate pyrophosphatase